MKSNEQPYRRRVEQPVERPGHLHDDKRYSHPAYGQISAHRVTGGAVLYGSDFRHDGYVEITIKRSEMNRTLARDWPSARIGLLRAAAGRVSGAVGAARRAPGCRASRRRQAASPPRSAGRGPGTARTRTGSAA